jgi:ATP-binding cassette, subfamily B, bacterial
MLRLLRPYRSLIALLVVLGFASNGASLVFPELIGQGMDTFTEHHVVSSPLVQEFVLAILVVAVLSSLQSLVQVYTSEKVARDLREQICHKLSRQSFSFVVEHGPDKLLTNLTSDVDAIKLFVSQAIAGLLSSAVILIGASGLLLYLNWKLALAVLSVVPVIGVTFALVLMRVRKLFKESREVVDQLNKVINESIVGAALIRVLNRMKDEMERFDLVNARSLGVNLSILAHFAAMIPVVTFTASLGGLIILLLGGKFVLLEQMTLGELAAFNSYLGLLIFPIFVMGFMAGVIARTRASWDRVVLVLDAPESVPGGTVDHPLRGDVEVKELQLSYEEKPVLRSVSFKLEPKSRTAIIGPTAAGKTQLLYLLTALLKPDSGTIRFDGQYEPHELKRQIGMVFQESVLFYASLRENIAFHPEVTPEGFQKAVETAELHDFIDTLPEGADTLVSERGTSLSGGQKQRVMLARALALEPDILLLDDFTARLDSATEERVLQNLRTNYPDLTLLAVTQRISTITDYDNIILMMEGEVLATGTHQQLMESSPDYRQIYESQKSTHEYE